MVLWYANCWAIESKNLPSEYPVRGSQNSKVRQREENNSIQLHLLYRAVISTSRVPVEGKSSVCLICVKYRIFLIIIIISLGQILSSYILQIHHALTNGRTRVHTCERVHIHRRRSGYRYSMGLWHPTVTPCSSGDNGWSMAIKYWRPGFPEVLSVFRIKKIVG